MWMTLDNRCPQTAKWWWGVLAAWAAATLVLGNAWAANQGSESLNPQGGDYGEPRLLVESPEDDRISHLSWPKVVVTEDRTVVLGYSAGIGHNAGASGPAVSVSRDGGKTFSPPQVLRYFPDDDDRYDDCGNLAMGVAEDGAIVLLAMAYRGDANTIVGWRSITSGMTWQRIDTSELAQDTTGSVYGHVLQVPGKGLVVFGHYREPSTPNQGVWMSVSTDDGQTWERPKTVTDETVYYEPAFTFTKGRFIGLLRAPEKDLHTYDMAISEDGGETWEIRDSGIALPEDDCLFNIPLNPPSKGEFIRYTRCWWFPLRRGLGGCAGSQPSPFIAVCPSSPYTLYAIQSIRGEKEDTQGRACLWTANAEDLEWNRKGRIAAIPADAGHLSDWSYPWMTPLNDEEWFLAFYAGSDSESSIYGITLELEPRKSGGAGATPPGG